MIKTECQFERMKTQVVRLEYQACMLSKGARKGLDIRPYLSHSVFMTVLATEVCIFISVNVRVRSMAVSRVKFTESVIVIKMVQARKYVHADLHTSANIVHVCVHKHLLTIL